MPSDYRCPLASLGLFTSGCSDSLIRVATLVTNAVMVATKKSSRGSHQAISDPAPRFPLVLSLPCLEGAVSPSCLRPASPCPLASSRILLLFPELSVFPLSLMLKSFSLENIFLTSGLLNLFPSPWPVLPLIKYFSLNWLLLKTVLSQY